MATIQKNSLSRIGPTAAATAAIFAAAGCDSRPAASPQSSAAPVAAAAPATQPAAPTASPASAPPPQATSKPWTPGDEPIADNADFLKRPTEGAIVRVVSYNSHWDDIFPDKSKVRPERFARIFRALDADVWALQEIGEHTAEQTVALANSIRPLEGGATWHAHQANKQVVLSRFPIKQTAGSFNPPSYRDATIALIDLPDAQFPADLCILNNHFKCCDGEKNDPIRQKQADANMSWIHDAQQEGGKITFPEGTAYIVCGDFNLVGGRGPLTTVETGNIADEQTYGADFEPDWDGTAFTVLPLKHNGIGPEYTWRNDNDRWPPNRLDYMVYSDSVLRAKNAFLLNTATIADAALESVGLKKWDVALDDGFGQFDHFPLVADFEVVKPDTTSDQP